MWIKICGVNDPATVRAIAEAHPDAIGLNFCEGSLRCVTCHVARKIVASLPSRIEAIGVFVNPPAQTLWKTVGDCGLAGIQCHAAGDDDWLSEPEVWELRLGRGESTDARTGRAVKRIRAFQIGQKGPEDIGQHGLGALERYFAREGWRNELDACLVDSYVEGMYGGTGQTVSWEVLGVEYRREEWPPLILAGGLRPENVAEAIEVARPWGVDVASGVESSPGHKDPELVARFVDEARRAFRRVSDRDANSP
jgi:phosphoribosylanthranilate isomerase